MPFSKRGKKMKAKKLIPLLLSIAMITAIGCGKTEAGSNSQSVEAYENETDATDTELDIAESDNIELENMDEGNTDEAAKLAGDSSLGGKDDYALDTAGDANYKGNSHEAYVRQ